MDWVEFALIRLYNFSTFIKEDNKDLVGTGKNLTLDRCEMRLLLWYSGLSIKFHICLFNIIFFLSCFTYFP